MKFAFCQKINWEEQKTEKEKKITLFKMSMT